MVDKDKVIHAIEVDDVAALKILVTTENIPIAINIPNKADLLIQYDLLSYAAKKGAAKTVKFLIETWPEHNWQFYPALEYAIRKDYAEIVTLISSIPRVDLVDDYYLKLATRKDSCISIEVLLRHRDIEITYDTIRVAVQNNSLGALRLLTNNIKFNLNLMRDDSKLILEYISLKTQLPGLLYLATKLPLDWQEITFSSINYDNNIQKRHTLASVKKLNFLLERQVPVEPIFDNYLNKFPELEIAENKLATFSKSTHAKSLRLVQRNPYELIFKAQDETTGNKIKLPPEITTSILNMVLKEEDLTIDDLPKIGEHQKKILEGEREILTRQYNCAKLLFKEIDNYYQQYIRSKGNNLAKVIRSQDADGLQALLNDPDLKLLSPKWKSAIKNLSDHQHLPKEYQDKINDIFPQSFVGRIVEQSKSLLGKRRRE
jgi:hypothetical protein